MIAFEGFDKNSKIHRDKVLTWYGVPKFLFWFYSTEKNCKKMERKITTITKIGDSISIIFNDGESAVFYPFAKTIYTQTSPGVLKKTLIEFKKDIQEFGFDAEVLSRLYIKNYGSNKL